jgi:hypothetical protein
MVRLQGDFAKPLAPERRFNQGGCKRIRCCVGTDMIPAYWDSHRRTRKHLKVGDRTEGYSWDAAGVQTFTCSARVISKRELEVATLHKSRLVTWVED